MNIFNRYYKVAGLTIQVKSDYPVSDNTFHPKFKKFRAEKPGIDNIKIHHHFHLPELPGNIKKFERFNDIQWQIYKTRNKWIYKYRSCTPMDPDHCATAIFSLDHTYVDIYTADFDEKRYQNYRSPALTFLNSDQILFSKLLCDRNGLILHSNGFDINGHGILLAGKSGAGKSTLSAMLKKTGCKILCDDRMFIIRKEERFWLAGHWCHGSVPDVSNHTAPLKAIFFLAHAKKNKITRIQNKIFMTQKIIQSMVKSFFNKQDWAKTFSTIEELVETTRFYELQFDLSGEICHKINKILEK